jgi:hypothetical protein
MSAANARRRRLEISFAGWKLARARIEPEGVSPEIVPPLPLADQLPSRITKSAGRLFAVVEAGFEAAEREESSTAHGKRALLGLPSHPREYQPIPQ